MRIKEISLDSFLRTGKIGGLELLMSKEQIVNQTSIIYGINEDGNQMCDYLVDGFRLRFGLHNNIIDYIMLYPYKYINANISFTLNNGLIKLKDSNFSELTKYMNATNIDWQIIDFIEKDLLVKVGDSVELVYSFEDDGGFYFIQSKI